MTEIISIDDLKNGDEIIVTIKTKVGDGCVCTGLSDGLYLGYLRAATQGAAKVKVTRVKRQKVIKEKVTL